MSLLVAVAVVLCCGFRPPPLHSPSAVRKTFVSCCSPGLPTPQGRLVLDHEVAAALTGGLNGGGLPAPGAPSSPVPAPAAFSPPRNGFHPATDQAGPVAARNASGRTRLPSSRLIPHVNSGWGMAQRPFMSLSLSTVFFCQRPTAKPAHA